MDKSGLVIYLPDDSALSDHGKPLMLQEVLFCPVLTWCARVWMSRGIGRFFVVCDRRWREDALACFPQGADVVWTESPPAGEELEEVREPVMPRGELMIAFHTGEELGRLQDAWHQEIVDRHRRSGVLVLDPATAFIDPRAVIAPGTVLLPNVLLRGETSVGRDCEIGPNAVITRCKLGDGVVVNASQISDSTIGDGSDVGPYAHIRPGCVVGPKCHIGAFVQLKNSTLGEGTKMSHLTYVGDSDVGAGVNFGCGTVTSNYDGFSKHRTVIGDNAFIGCNTSLIPPVEVGAGAYIAAGATVTRSVPPDSLAISRVRQENREGWAKKNRQLKSALKKLEREKK